MARLPKKQKKRNPFSGSGKKIFTSRKAFIADVIVDFWAYILFALIIIIFAVLYKWTASEASEKLTDFKGVTWSNYLAEVYLRTPVEVEGLDMEMAEIIALFDYNQSLYSKTPEAKGMLESFVEGVGSMYVEAGSSLKNMYLGSFDNTPQGNAILQGKRNALFDGIDSITKEFVSDNFDSFNTCYIFMIEGNHFRYVKYGSLAKCKKYSDTKLDVSAVPAPFPIVFPTIEKELRPEHFLALLSNIPKESYLTLIPPIDPRKDPIKLYVIYDMDAILKMRQEDETIMD